MITNRKVPNKSECSQLIQKYCGDSYKAIYKHVFGVLQLSLFISKQINQNNKHNVDLKLVTAGSLLHDIGRCAIIVGKEHIVMHCVKGAKILEREGVDQKVIDIVMRHVGTGISIEDMKRDNLPLDPSLCYTPQTVEELIVSYSDNRLKNREIVDVWFPIARFSKEFGIKKGIEVANQHNKLIELGFAYEYPETPLIRTKKIGLDELYHKINSDNNSSAV